MKHLVVNNINKNKGNLKKYYLIWNDLYRFNKISNFYYHEEGKPIFDQIYDEIKIS